MAGFDMEFTYDSVDEPLVDAFVAATRRRARRAGLRRWRSERLRDGRTGWYFAVDGHSGRMALLAQKIERDLPIVAEAIAVPQRSLRQRRHLANGFVDIYARCGYGLEEVEEAVPHLVPKTAVGFTWVPHLLEYPGDVNIAARLEVTEAACIDWHFGDIPAPTMLEELHTAAELVLDHAVHGRFTRKTFADNVGAASSAGILDGCHQLAGRQCRLPVRKQASEVLIALKDTRREVRHRADPRADVWLREHFFHVIYVLETIVETVASRDRE